MRYLVALLGIALCLNSSQANELESVTTFKSKEGFELTITQDLMDDSESLSVGTLKGVSEANDKGIVIAPSFKKEKGQWVYNYLMVGAVGIGNCHEKSELLILFEDGSKRSFYQWGDFTCDTYMGFDLSESLRTEGTRSPIKAMRLSNGYSYEKWTHIVKDQDEKNFLLRVFRAVDELNNT